MAYTFVYVIFLEKSFCNVEDTDIIDNDPTSKLQCTIVQISSFWLQNQIYLIITTKKLVYSKYFL